MGFAALQSVFCDGGASHWVPLAPAPAFAVSGPPSRSSHPPPSPAPFAAGSSSRALSFPPESYGSSPARPTPGTFHGLPRPHRDVSQKSPRSRASQARSVPPSTFRTSSTACSSSGLAGLFRPAAAYRVRSSGVSSREKPCGLVARLCPPVVCAPSLPAVSQWLQDVAAASRALLRSRIRCGRRWVRPPPARSPLELSSSLGFSFAHREAGLRQLLRPRPFSALVVSPVRDLPPAYLLSVERWPFHSGPPDH